MMIGGIEMIARGTKDRLQMTYCIVVAPVRVLYACQDMGL